MTYLKLGKKFEAPETKRMPAVTQAQLAAMTLPDSQRPTTKMLAVKTGDLT